MSVDQVSAALPTSLALLRHGVILVGFSFLFSGVWAFLAVPSQRTRLLAVLGFAFSAGFSAGPYFTSPTVRAAAGAVLTLAITAGLAVLTHFLLVFPTPKRMMRRRTTIWALYGPAAVVGLLTVWVAAAQPAATSGVNVFFRTLFGLAVVGYFAASLVALAHSYVKADARSRVCTGLNLLLAGAAVGLGPSLLITLAGLVAPQVVIPGAGFFLLGIGVLPVTFVLAAVRAGRALPTPSVTTMDRGLSPVGPAANATTSRASRRSE